MSLVRRFIVCVLAAATAGSQEAEGQVATDSQRPRPANARARSVRSIDVVGSVALLDNLWAVVGETLRVEYRETTLASSGATRIALSALWSSTDSSVASLAPAAVDSFAPGRVLALRPGMAMIRATPVGASVYTGRSNIGRGRPAMAIVVTRPIARVQVVPIDTAWYAGERARYFVRVTDVDGRVVDGIGVSTEVIDPTGQPSSGSATSSTGSDASGLGVMPQGPMMVIASLRHLSDTLRITVRPRRGPP